MSEGAPRRRRWAAHLPGTAALALLTVVTALTFCRVFAGWSFVPSLLTVGLAAHTLAALGRVARLPGRVAVPGALGGVCLVVAWIFHPDTLWSALPTLDTWRAARADLADAWAQVSEAIPPVDHEGGFGLAAAVSLGFAAVVADALAFRAGGRVEALVPTGLVFVAVSAVGTDRNRLTSTAVWLAVALSVVAVLRAAEALAGSTWVGPRVGAAWRRWSAGWLTLAVSAGLAAAVAGPRLPGAGEEPWFDPDPSGGASTAAISPLVDIRGRLTNQSATVLFTVTADRPTYWRLTSLPRFDGTRWVLPERALDEAGGQLADPPASARPVHQRFEVEALDGNLLPVAYTPTELRAASRDLYFVLDTATLVVAGDGLKRGDSYEIVSSVPEPTAEDLLVASARTPPDPVYLELPESFTPDLVEVARRVTVGAVTPYQQALALQNWLRGFTYDLEVPSGHSTEAIREFLHRRSGYCEQFAGTFAALARALGLPARVAVGFTPGQLGGDGKYRVRSLHAHAWPEVWFDDYGWVMFEPTPGRGAPGAEAHTGVPAGQEELPPEPETGTATTGAPSPATTVAPSRVLDAPGGPLPTSADAAASDPARGSSLAPWILGGLGLALAWLTLMPIALRAWVRRHTADDTLLRWRATVAAFELAGIRSGQGETFIEQAIRFAKQTDLDPRELRELAAAATFVVYSGRPLDEATQQRVAVIGRRLEATTRSMMPWKQRLLARVDPRRAWRLAGS